MFRKKLGLIIIASLLFTLIPMTPQNASSASALPVTPQFTKQLDLEWTFGHTFVDLSLDGKTYVALDNSNGDFFKGSQVLGISVASLDAKGKWTLPVKIAENGIKESMPLFETHPVISGDGKTIVYLGHDATNNVFRMYESIKQSNGKWSKPVIIESIPSGWFGLKVSIDKFGKTLSYSQGGGGFFGGSSSLYVVRKVDGVWGTPVKAHAEDTTYSYFAGELDENGDTLVYSKATSNYDIYVTDYKDGAWQEPVRFTSTNYDELESSISGDGNTIGYYARFVENSIVTGREFYVVSRKDSKSPWGKPVKISNREPSQLTLDCPAAFDFTGKNLVRVKYVNTKYENGDSYLSGSEIVQQGLVNGKWSKSYTLAKTDSDYNAYVKASYELKHVVYQHFNSLAYIKKIK